jgi:endonuclease/exonuclease/phosphatase family metal-dependent hydrolase
MGDIRFVWWNLENLFDVSEGDIATEFEFTAANGWTPEVLDAKKKNLAAALAVTHAGQGPELLAVCEIEKDELLEQILVEMGVDSHMKVVFDPAGTSDLRGIDVAMAYDDRKLKLESRESHVVHLRYRTRDIFEVRFSVKETGEQLEVLAGHWPSRRLGKYRSDPLRAAVAEHVAFLVEGYLKVSTSSWQDLKNANDLQTLQGAWEGKVLVCGDLNDEPFDRSLCEHLRASPDYDLVTGSSNDMSAFHSRVQDYQAQEIFLFDPMWRFLHPEQTGSFYMASLPTGERFVHRYQTLDQIVASRGLARGPGLKLNANSVAIFREAVVATPSGRPRPFNWTSKKGTSDHLPLEAMLEY